MNPDRIKAILFDLGGVLIELSGEAHLRSMLGENLARDEIWHRWAQSPAVQAHETGMISSVQFAHSWVTEQRLDISPDTFIDGFKGWLKAPFPGAHELLADTSARYTTAILSNTSAIHWPIIETMSLHNGVHHVVKSYEIGALKPDRLFYDHALHRLGIESSEAIFFDDTAANVAGAQAAGLHAFCVYGAEEARRILEQKGLLAP